MIISTVSLKGGVGKTTAAINLAVYLKLKKFSVLLIDADENGNSLKWSGIRDQKETPITTVSLPNAAALRNNINELHKGIDFVIIDGTPAVNEIAATIMLLSDIAIFPIQASPLDLWAFNDKFLPKFNDIKVVKPELLGIILLNSIDSRTNLSGEIREAVETYEMPILKSILADRTVYRDSLAYGLSALECKDKKAISEVESFGKEIIKYVKMF